MKLMGLQDDYPKYSDMALHCAGGTQNPNSMWRVVMMISSCKLLAGSPSGYSGDQQCSSSCSSTFLNE